MNVAEATGTLKVGLALGSGSARGLSHIGVLQGLLEVGIQPAVVCGTSIGSLVGAAFCSGNLDEFGRWFAAMSTRDVFRYMDIRPITRGGVGRADRLISHLRELFGSPRIEDLPYAYAAVATDLATGREIWIQQGDLWDAVRGSIAIPGLLSPVRINKRWVVDGGLVNPVPVSVCRALGANLIIAVNLNDELNGRQQARLAQKITHPPGDQRPEPGLFDRLASGIREISPTLLTQWLEADQKSHPDDDTPGIFSVVTNAINIMQDRITRSRLAGEPADVMITPRLAHIGLLDFDTAAEAINEGCAAARRCAPQIRYALGLGTPGSASFADEVPEPESR
ncbi:MAG: patatin-like phospholipase family protein [Gammaproteobacteria bacterium]|jgi:NTE family protein|nr:patatin-like phospholipase family protein [Gammaproteobacteria bacterium]MBP6053600.1 patatin-like phospholipase family protein [Pseudomonadales bacterium]MBK6581399.1 patatin-like phospholipase family protein [Gammaproteobacteria bacterium]MBK7167789.1 patatin-like phospholipase family protein [Gammaproteobacteria bacterium]MBK7518650.1 patatin-like phospholipase family protein [Gammaproteobacteria bacterium]